MLSLLPWLKKYTDNTIMNKSGIQQEYLKTGKEYNFKDLTKDKNLLKFNIYICVYIYIFFFMELKAS